MAFESTPAYAESDADDEYERSVHASSPVLATDDEGSEEEEDGSEDGNEHTPTTYGRTAAGDGLPETIVTEWTAEECADFVGGLGLGMYVEGFLGELIPGRGGGKGRERRGLMWEQRMKLQARVWSRSSMRISSRWAWRVWDTD